MSEPTKMHALYQVYATEVKSGKDVIVPMFPRASKQACDKWANDMTNMILKGFEKRYRNVKVVLYGASHESEIILEK